MEFIWTGRKAFVATVNVNDIDIKLPVYPLPGQTSGTIGIAMGYGRGGNSEDIGKLHFNLMNLETI